MINYNNISILIFDSGGRQALPICKGFFEMGCKVTSYCKSVLDTGYLTKYKNNRILFNDKNENGYDFYEFGLQLIKSGKFDLVVPMSDPSAIFLSKHKKDLERHSKIAVNDWEKVQLVSDKVVMMSICEKNNIPAPRTIISNNPMSDFRNSDLLFPVVVKPRTACGSIGFNIVRNEKQLAQIFNSNTNGPLLIQEYIPNKGGQYEAEVFRFFDGTIKSCVVSKVHRIFPLDGGSPVLNETIENSEIRDLVQLLADILDWNGYIDFDLIYDERDKKYKVLEANPRIGADVKLDFISGVNISNLIFENEYGNNNIDFQEYKCGINLVCGITDILWFIKSQERFKSKPSWFKRSKYNDAVFTSDDIKPFVGFCLQHLFHYRNDMKKRMRINNLNVI